MRYALNRPHESSDYRSSGNDKNRCRCRCCRIDRPPADDSSLWLLSRRTLLHRMRAPSRFRLRRLSRLEDSVAGALARSAGFVMMRCGNGPHPRLLPEGEEETLRFPCCVGSSDRLGGAWERTGAGNLARCANLWPKSAASDPRAAKPPPRLRFISGERPFLSFRAQSRNL